MSDVSSRTRELLDLARQDAPTAAARDSMWAGIQMAALSAPPSVPSAPASNPVASLAAKAVASSKLALGIALGASITVGVAGAILAIARPWAAPAAHVAQPRELERPDRVLVDRPQDLRLPATPVVVTGHVATPATDVELDPVREKPAVHVMSERDRLAQEARMVSEARGALQRGDPQAALRLVRAARATRGARLVPEELTVEAQALRAMGDEAGAKRADAELAGKFPEQDLGP